MDNITCRTISKLDIVIDSELKSLIPALSKDEFHNLEYSIINEGCRDSLILWDNVLIDGHNRYEICTKNNIPFGVTNKSFDSRDDASIWMIKNQFGRRNLVPYVRAELALKLEGFFKKTALENKQESGKLYGENHPKSQEICQNSDKPLTNSSTNEATDEEPTKEQSRNDYARTNRERWLEEERCKKLPAINPIKPIDTKKELAKIAGVSHDTIERVKTIQEKAPDELKQKVSTGEISINQAYTTIKREEKEQKRNDEVKENTGKVQKARYIDELKGLFQTIVIDPPWDWGDESDINQMGRARPDYATIPYEDLLEYPVSKFADDNCQVYLWITNHSLPKGFELLKSWGFRYITCLTWVKPSFGMGNYFRGSTEQVLFGVKGSAPLKRKDVGTHFEAPRGKQHSEKPIEFYKLVESCSYGPYLELFSRHEREGWTMWGEQ